MKKKRELNRTARIAIMVILLISQTGLFFGLNNMHRANSVARANAQAEDYSLTEKNIDLFMNKQSFNMDREDLRTVRGLYVR